MLPIINDNEEKELINIIAVGILNNHAQEQEFKELLLHIYND